MNYKGLQQSPSIFHEHPFTFSSLFFYSDMFSTLFFQKKVLFLSVSSLKKAGVRECRQERGKKVITEKEKEALTHLEKGGLMGDEQKR